MTARLTISHSDSSLHVGSLESCMPGISKPWEKHDGVETSSHPQWHRILKLGGTHLGSSPAYASKQFIEWFVIGVFILPDKPIWHEHRTAGINC